ncbi:MAG: ABC transporter permease [Ferruginibacter sp.]|nr:ABC transporter permease [Ferruginibacter sp.]
MNYSQFRAMLAITKASLRSITRSPSAIIFSIIFPFIFILIFGFISDGGATRILKVAIDKKSDTANVLYKALESNPSIRIVQYSSADEQKSELNKGRIAGVIYIEKQTLNNSVGFNVSLKSSSSSNDKWPQLKSIIDAANNEISNQIFPNRPAFANFQFNPKQDIEQVREYKTIDFVLPGQLGFSLLSAGVFGVAFMFFNLRNTLVLKRFFATPIKRLYIIYGEGLSRVIFQMMTAFVIILAGYLFFGFTLIHGFQTFIELMILSFLGLVIFMGFGFIISGFAKTDSTIPPFANLIILPQFLLGGTFFSADVFPQWLQAISKVMPLTHLNAALRKVAFEGLSLLQVKSEVGILLLWGLVLYTIAVKVFKWE